MAPGAVASRFTWSINLLFYAYSMMCINEVMEYWWLENGQCLQVSKLDPISKSVRLPWFDIEL
jgi:hypothetical protein